MPIFVETSCTYLIFYAHCYEPNYSPSSADHPEPANQKSEILILVPSGR